MKLSSILVIALISLSVYTVDIEKELSVKFYYETRQRLQGIAYHTPLQYMAELSEKYDCNVFVKREDLQVVRSYKIRGAYNKMSTTPKDLLNKGVVCASAGNHAQGVAFSCSRLKVNCKIFMPAATPLQKINKVKGFGREYVEIILTGKDFDEAFAAADQYTKKNDATFVHPFNDLKVIAG
jgi:threonine dehydratase